LAPRYESRRMTLEPLLLAPLAIRLHAIAAIFALIIGTFVIFRRKGDRLHKFLGRIWVTLMLVLSVSAFFINDIRMFGPFSLLHILAIVTIVSLATALWHIRHGNIDGHRATMRWVYFAALIGAGLFTLLPGRLLHEVATGSDTGWLPFIIAAVVAGTAAFIYFRYRKRIDRI
jgi:LPXTG-motif cell wall-anchored protein